jgi:hypothetical protein
MDTPGPNWQPMKFSNALPPRVGSAIFYHPSRRKAMVFGGWDLSKGEVSESWSINGSKWEPGSVSTSPSPRSRSAVVWNDKLKGAVLFGGFGHGNPLGDTWFYNGSNWLSQQPQSSPSPRAGMSLAYDAAHDQTLLFGGATTMEGRYHVDFGDTWIWDGTNWQQQFPVNSPPMRSEHQMVYDPVHQVILLFGGGLQGTVHDDTWIWDGTNWIEQHPLHHPSARSNFAMAFDEGRGQILLFGGYSFNGFETDTWAWDGQDWIQIQTQSSPPPEISFSPKMVYLPSQQTMVLMNSFQKKSLDEKGDIVLSQHTEIWEFK